MNASDTLVYGLMVVILMNSHWPYIVSMQGAFGQVFAATLRSDTEEDRMVAVKTVQGQ